MLALRKLLQHESITITIKNSANTTTFLTNPHKTSYVGYVTNERNSYDVTRKAVNQNISGVHRARPNASPRLATESATASKEPR